jgi:DNA-binding transcriptional MerR regulator
MRNDICYIGDKKMKVVSVNGSRYYIQSKDDLVSLAHELAKKGYSIAQIAKILDVRESTARKYLQDCW